MNAKYPLIFLLTLCAVCFCFAETQEIRDPFVSISDKMIPPNRGDQESVQLPSPMILKGTLCSKNGLVAIINDDIVKEGQKWHDFYVIKIEKEKVFLEWRGKKFELRMNAEERKDKENR